jgi:hypothetical protein
MWDVSGKLGIAGTVGTVGYAERLWGNMNLVDRNKDMNINKDEH